MDIKLTVSGSAKELAQVLLMLNTESITYQHAQTDSLVDSVVDSVVSVDAYRAQTMPAKRTKTPKATEKVAAVASDPEPEQAAPAKEEPGERITFEKIREMAQAKSRAGHHSEILALLRELKVKTIPDIREEDRPSFYEKLMAI